MHCAAPRRTAWCRIAPHHVTPCHATPHRAAQHTPTHPVHPAPFRHSKPRSTPPTTPQSHPTTPQEIVKHAITEGVLTPVEWDGINPQSSNIARPPEQAKGAQTVVAAILRLNNLLLVAYMAVYHLVSNFYLETQIDQFER